MERHLYEILVPRCWNHGSEIPVDYHHEWDSQVRAISSGLTILRPAKGQWVLDGRLLEEEVIPCRVLASREEMDAIMDITLEHYPDQHCILAYRLSTEVIMRYRSE